MSHSEIDRIMQEAKEAFAIYDKAKRDLYDIEERLRDLCLDYGKVMSIWGFQPYMLRKAAIARGVIDNPLQDVTA